MWNSNSMNGTGDGRTHPAHGHSTANLMATNLQTSSTFGSRAGGFNIIDEDSTSATSCLQVSHLIFTFSMKRFLFIQRQNPLWCWLSVLHKRPVGGSTGELRTKKKRNRLERVTFECLPDLRVCRHFSGKLFWLVAPPPPALRSDWRSRPLHSLHQRRRSFLFCFTQKKKVFWLAHSFGFSTFSVEFCFIAKLLVSLKTFHPTLKFDINSTKRWKSMKFASKMLQTLLNPMVKVAFKNSNEKCPKRIFKVAPS